MRNSARTQTTNTTIASLLRNLLLTVFLFTVCGEIFATSETPAPPSIVDINAANAAEIAMALPGIGPKKAQRIVEWRNTHGPFQYREQLLDVKGIGPKTLKKMEGHFQIGDSSKKAGVKSTENSSGREILRDIIERANRDRKLALGLFDVN